MTKNYNKKKGRANASCKNSKTTIKSTHNSRYIHNGKSLKEGQCNKHTTKYKCRPHRVTR